MTAEEVRGLCTFSTQVITPRKEGYTFVVEYMINLPFDTALATVEAVAKTYIEKCLGLTEQKAQREGRRSAYANLQLIRNNPAVAPAVWEMSFETSLTFDVFGA